ncbi:MAG: hypothetical protein ACYCOU_12165 [Sulfobacillus sp.]
MASDLDLASEAMARDNDPTSAVYCRIDVDEDSPSRDLVVDTSALPSGSLLTDATTAAMLVQQASKRAELRLPVVCCIDPDAKRVFGYFHECCGDDTAKVVEDLQNINPGLKVVLLVTDAETAKVLLAQNKCPKKYNFKAVFWGSVAVPGYMV